jgi:hypothetical protein
VVRDEFGEVLVELFKELDEQIDDDGVRVVEDLLAPGILKVS